MFKDSNEGSTHFYGDECDPPHDDPAAYTPPMGVSAWREHGKKYGYWDYFQKHRASGCDPDNGHTEYSEAVAWTTSCKNPTHDDLLYRLSKNRRPAWLKVVMLTILAVGVIHFIQLSQVTVCEDAILRIITPS